jgi:uncharacterized damage-inducible protein DinB
VGHPRLLHQPELPASLLARQLLACHAGSSRRECALVADPETDLFEPIPHGKGQTTLREALLVADHNAYHIGQLVLLRRLLGAWG